MAENKIPSGWEFLSPIIWVRDLAELIESFTKVAPDIIIQTIGSETLFQYLFVFCIGNKDYILILKHSKDIDEMMNRAFSNQSIRDAGKDEHYSNNYELDKTLTKKYLKSELESLRIKCENKSFKMEVSALQNEKDKLREKINGIELGIKAGKIEALEKALEDKQGKEKKQIENMTLSYIESCEKFSTDKPTKAMLKKISGIEKDLWDHQLSNPIFLTHSLKEIKKKINQAKKTETTEFWRGVYNVLENNLGKAFRDSKVPQSEYKENYDYEGRKGKKKYSDYDSDEFIDNIEV